MGGVGGGVIDGVEGSVLYFVDHVSPNVGHTVVVVVVCMCVCV